MHWFFSSFEPEQFNLLFGGGHKELAHELKTAIHTYSEETYHKAVGLDLADDVIMHGISYKGLDLDQAQALDYLINVAFIQDPISTRLKTELESSEGLSLMVLSAFIERSLNRKKTFGFRSKPTPNRHIRVLDNFAFGRRYGETESNDDSEYLILDNQELKTLSKGIRKELQASGEWPEKWYPDYIDQELLRPVDRALDKGRHLFATYC